MLIWHLGLLCKLGSRISANRLVPCKLYARAKAGELLSPFLQALRHDGGGRSGIVQSVTKMQLRFACWKDAKFRQSAVAVRVYCLSSLAEVGAGRVRFSSYLQ